MMMIMRHIGFLLIICAMLTFAAGCTAPPPGLSERHEVDASPTPTIAVVPAATPTATIHSDLVTIVTPRPTPGETQDVREPAQETTAAPGINRTTIYSEKNDFRFNEIILIVNVPRAPLIIDLDITPEGFTRIKEGTSRYGERGDYQYQIYHISGNVWFECTVEDAETGTIIVKDGFGRTFSHDSRREIVIRRPGTYKVTFSGNFVTVDILMSIPEESVN